MRVGVPLLLQLVGKGLGGRVGTDVGPEDQVDHEEQGDDPERDQDLAEPVDHPSHDHLRTYRPLAVPATSTSVERAAMKASWGTSTRPTIFIRFLPSFCFSSSLRLRVMSPP